jgi:hypothetical protein
MKSFIAVIALATSLSALACPQLAGTYTCAEPGQDGLGGTISIGQVNVAGVERFIIEIEDSENRINTSYFTVGTVNSNSETAVCRGNSLRISSAEDVSVLKKEGANLSLTVPDNGGLQTYICNPVE